ncbi:MAG: response regulator transcription factor [Planctomycetes bacterium]|nr:response regulator transcription factor [Planctomycetota bacterium]
MESIRKPSVALLDTFVPVAKALSRLLPACGGIEWCGMASDLASWRSLLARTQPDVALVEPLGLGCEEDRLLELIASVSPGTRAVIFVGNEPHEPDSARWTDAASIVSKRMAPTEIVESIVRACGADDSSRRVAR